MVDDKGATTRISKVIYEKLRREIILGVLAPGVRLVLREIAERYRTSMFPVREALRMLEQDGLVVSIPHQGARVAELSVREIQDNFLIRSALEGVATEEATPHLTKKTLAALEESVRQQWIAARNGSHDLLVEQNRHFHGLIFQACPSQPMRELIDRLWQEQTKFRAVLGYEEGRELAAVDQHAQILERLRAGDPHGAGTAARLHRWATAEALIDYLNRRAEIRTEIEES
ncbi:GntR family transcriptional regulator [Actinophytocola sp.]|uniref:GntR family transcriptional regulator n=1 Tax=Actinophytocola sp. TaxID=1872138 RepID=UPI003D6A7541